MSSSITGQLLAKLLSVKANDDLAVDVNHRNSHLPGFAHHLLAAALSLVTSIS